MPVFERVADQVKGVTGFTEFFPYIFDHSDNSILMYHSVGEAEQWGNVSTERFRSDLAYVAEHFEVVDLPDVISTANSTKKVAITFDDGFRNFYSNALPVIEDLNVPATVFVTLGFVAGNETPRIRDSLQARGQDVALTEAHLLELRDHPLVTIGNHTRTHPNLSELSERECYDEIAGAKSELEDLVGATIDRFSYPYGRFNPTVKSVVDETHELAVTTMHGHVTAKSDRTCLPRVAGHLDERLFRLQMTDVSGTVMDVLRRHGLQSA